MKTSCCAASETVIYPCAGASNLGQLTNIVALELRSQAVADISCTSGVGVGIPSLVETARKAKRVIVIDGCSLNCALTCLTKAGRKPDVMIMISDLGIIKTHDKPSESDAEKVFRHVLNVLGLK